MSTKYNTEEIMMLIPDYITGEISSSDKALVEKALDESPEIRELYNEMKSSMAFIGTVKQAEPSPQYWNTLLPRIHEKIDARESRGFSWEKLSLVWKVLVPVAAVILIALVYYIVKPSNTQLTEEKKIENKINDSSEKQNKEKNPQENIKEKQDNLVKENEIQEKNKIEKNQIEKNFRKSENIKDKNNENLVKDEDPVENKETQRREIINDEQYSEELDVDETAVFASGGAAGLDEDTENELKKLNSTEQNKLLEELLNSNL